MTDKERVEHIGRELETTGLWAVEDFEDFYKRDVPFLVEKVRKVWARERTLGERLGEVEKAVQAELDEILKMSNTGLQRQLLAVMSRIANALHPGTVT